MIIAYIAFYIAAYFFSKSGHYFLSGFVLIIAALGLYASDYLRTKNLINLRGLFSLSFVGGQGISCLKLSRLQTDWANETWLCFALAFLGFYLVYEFMIRRYKSAEDEKGYDFDENRLFICIVVLTMLSLISFIIEAAVLNYIPLFVRGVPHAYSEFHLPALHYVTVSCVLVPAFSVVWFMRSETGIKAVVDKDPQGKTKRIILIIASLVAFSIPILCVSRFQLAFSVVLALFTYIALEKNTPWKLIIIIAVVFIPLYLILTVARSHDAAYLASIFEMKADVPVLFSHPYMYIANNYDNFNACVNSLEEHTWGLKMLYPFFTLSGLKFAFPQLAAFPIYVTKTELTTLTLFYDFYYDYGVTGVLIASMLIGLMAYAVERITRGRNDAVASVIYAQFAIYMGLSFFTTWFSNPTTWFYFAVSGIIYLIAIKHEGVRSRI